LKAAVDQGADAVYVGLKDQTNARNFGGLNFDENALVAGIRYAKDRGVKVFLTLNTYPQAGETARWQRGVDKAIQLGADALIMADAGLLHYAKSTYPDMPLHLSVQAAVTNEEAIGLYQDHFGIERVVLPRVLSWPQVERLSQQTSAELELFGFGGLCVMMEGRCLLSSYVTGISPNSQGVCSPASAVRWQKTPKGLESRLNGILLDCYGDNEKAGYPTLCKGRFRVADHTYYAIEEPTSLNTLALLPEMHAAGVSAIKIEGRQRSPAYVSQAIGVWRSAIDAVKSAPQSYRILPEWTAQLNKLSEGTTHTLGAYNRPWK
jgi:putative protease